MDHERVLSVFLHVIDYFIQWISATEHCLLLVELGFQQPSFFQTNTGEDFIQKIYVKFCSNALSTHKICNNTVIEKPFIIHERIYRYSMTPFDLRYRLFHLSELVDHKYRYVLKNNDSFFTTVYGIIIIFNKTTGRLGIACDIESARSQFQKETGQKLSDFFLLHQCCLIIRDIIGIIENTIADIDTSIIPLPQATLQLHP